MSIYIYLIAISSFRDDSVRSRQIQPSYGKGCKEDSATGRLQRFKQLIVQASLSKQKMVFSPAPRGAKKVIPSSDTKATIMARSRRYADIVRLEQMKLSKPLNEMCWDDSPAGVDPAVLLS